MTVHLTLPWAWEQCRNRRTCDNIIHLNESLETVELYPQEWIQHLFPHYILSHDAIYVMDEKKMVYHNLHGPAIQHPHGLFLWYVNGVLHRRKGPAVKDQHTQEWWLNGKLHRLDGPAVVHSNGRKEWWINGKKKTQ